MKKILFSIILTLGIFALSSAQKPKSQKRTVGTFNEIHAGKGINVTLIEGNKENVLIEIENGDVTDVITDLKGRKLSIRLKTKIYKELSVMVYVTYRSLKSITTGTGAFIQTKGTLYAEDLEVKAGTGSTIVLDVDVKTINSNLSSSKIELVGKTDFQDASVNTGGRYIADKLKSKEALIRVNTGGNALVNVTEKLDAKTTTGGKITYTGNPEKSITKGNIQKE